MYLHFEVTSPSLGFVCTWHRLTACMWTIIVVYRGSFLTGGWWKYVFVKNPTCRQGLSVVRPLVGSTNSSWLSWWVGASFKEKSNIWLYFTICNYSSCCSFFEAVIKTDHMLNSWNFLSVCLLCWIHLTKTLVNQVFTLKSHLHILCYINYVTYTISCLLCGECSKMTSPLFELQGKKQHKSSIVSVKMVSKLSLLTQALCVSVSRMSSRRKAVVFPS